MAMLPGQSATVRGAGCAADPVKAVTAGARAIATAKPPAKIKRRGRTWRIAICTPACFAGNPASGLRGDSQAFLHASSGHRAGLARQSHLSVLPPPSGTTYAG